MGKAKKYFLFNLEWEEILSELPKEVKHEVYDAIIEYAKSGKLSDLRPIAKGCFLFIKKELDYNDNQYKRVIDARKEAGSKGGKARQNKQIQAKQANATFAKQNKQMLLLPSKTSKPKQTQANQAVYDNDNDIINISFPKEKDMSVPGETDACPQKEHAKEEIDFDKLMQFFNSQVEKANSSIAKICRMTPERRKLLSCRCREYGKAAIENVIINAVTSDFLNGSKDFVASFNWLFESRNFLKILEGTYNNRPKNGNNKADNAAGQWSGRNGVRHKGSVDFDCGLVLPKDS